TGAQFFMTEIDYKSLDVIMKDESLPYLERDYTLANVPNDLKEKIFNISRGNHKHMDGTPEEVSYLSEGDTFIIGKGEYEVIFTPGHSEGLIVLYNKEDNVLLSTDHILPKITPNISYWFYGEENPLISYEKSLNKIKKLNASFVI